MRSITLALLFFAVRAGAEDCEPKLETFMTTERLAFETNGIPNFSGDGPPVSIEVRDRSTAQVVATLSAHIAMARVGNTHRQVFRVVPRTLKLKGRGFATEAKLALLDYAFRRLNVEGSFARVSFLNIASVRLHEKLGFVKLEIRPSERGIREYYLSRNNFSVVMRKQTREGPRFFTPRRPPRESDDVQLDWEPFRYELLIFTARLGVKAVSREMVNQARQTLTQRREVLDRHFRERVEGVSNVMRLFYEGRYVKARTELETPLASALVAEALGLILLHYQANICEPADVLTYLDSLAEVGLPGAEIATQKLTKEFLQRVRPLFTKTD